MIIAFASALFTPTGFFNVNYCVPDTPGSTPRPNLVTINGVDHTDAVLRLYKTSLGFGLTKLRNEARAFGESRDREFLESLVEIRDEIGTCRRLRDLIREVAYRTDLDSHCKRRTNWLPAAHKEAAGFLRSNDLTWGNKDFGQTIAA